MSVHPASEQTLRALVAALLLAIGMAIGMLVHTDRPHCPTEDSCRADYSHGEWHITEVTP